MATVDELRRTAEFPSYWLDIDEVLGAREDRFFGSIFRSAHQQADVALEAGRSDRWAVRGRASVTHGRGWGRRNDVARTPHLSSLDAVLIMAQTVRRIEERLQSRGWLNDAWHLAPRRIVLRAGAQPDEDTTSLPLDGFATIARTTAERVQAECRIRLGGMNVLAELIPLPGRTRYEVPLVSSSLPEMRIKDIMLNGSRRQAHGRVCYGQQQLVCDAFVYLAHLLASGQLAQVFIAIVDGVPRERGNTLWLRRFDGRWDPPAATTAALHAQLCVTRHKHLTANRRLWSIVEGQARALGITCTYSIVHDITR